MKNNLQPSENYFKYANHVFQAIDKKTETGTLDTKIDLVDGGVLLLKALVIILI